MNSPASLDPSAVYDWCVFLYLTVDLAGCFGLPAPLVRAGKAVCWLLMLLGLLGVFGHRA